jgi:hypothetical protein
MVILLETVAKDANLVHNNLVVVHQHVSLVVSWDMWLETAHRI